MNDPRDICKNYHPRRSLRGCIVGRIAPIDCAGCTYYQEELVPADRNGEDVELWELNEARPWADPIKRGAE